MSPAQKEAYEENKLKMRKAIADPALVDETEQVPKLVWDRILLCCLLWDASLWVSDMLTWSHDEQQAC